MADRIHKVLANAGYGSRREIETLIRNGKISVNGKLATIGQSIEAKDRVTINSRSIRLHLQNKNIHSLSNFIFRVFNQIKIINSN